MSLRDLKITDAQMEQHGVVAAPDTLTGTADENKAVFDRLIRQIVSVAVNQLIDLLTGATAAAELGAAPFEGVAGETVQQQITDVQGNLTEGTQAVQENLDTFIQLLQSQDGAGKVGVAPFEGVTETTLQEVLQKLQENLRVASNQVQNNLNAYIQLLQSQAGAAKVGLTPFDGMPSTDVQAALQALRKAIDDIQAGIIPVGSVSWEMLAASVQAIIDGKLNLSGGTMQGAIDMGTHAVTGLPQSTQQTDAVRLSDMQQAIANVESATLSPETAALYGLGGDAVPDDAFNVLLLGKNVYKKINAIKDAPSFTPTYIDFSSAKRNKKYLIGIIPNDPGTHKNKQSKVWIMATEPDGTPVNDSDIRWVNFPIKEVQGVKNFGQFIDDSANILFDHETFIEVNFSFIESRNQIIVRSLSYTSAEGSRLGISFVINNGFTKVGIRSGPDTGTYNATFSLNVYEQV